MHIREIEQQAKAPRTEAAWHAFNQSASGIPFRDFARKLEQELEAEKRTRRNAEKVTTDALTARDQAEADRDKARAQRDAFFADVSALVKLAWEQTRYIEETDRSVTGSIYGIEYADKTIAKVAAQLIAESNPQFCYSEPPAERIPPAHDQSR